MASYDLVKIDSLDVNSELNSSERSDMCGSMDIIETYEGYTCYNSGIVLEVQKLEYNRPYDKDILQHAVISKTQIGNLYSNPTNFNLSKRKDSPCHQDLMRRSKNYRGSWAK